MKKYITPNLYLYIGKTKQTWYHKQGNHTKAIGDYPAISQQTALDIVMGKIYPKSVGELLQEFIEHQKPFLSQQSCKRHRLLFNNFKRTSPLFNMRATELSTIHILNYYKEFTKYKKLFRTHVLLKQTYNYAIIHQYATTNPFLAIPINMVLPKPKVKHRSYSITDNFIKRLLIFISKQNSKIKLAFIMLLTLALRVNTLVNLKISMLDFNKNLLIIPSNIMKMQIEHILPINNELAIMLKTYIKENNINEYLFPSNYKLNKAIRPEVFRLLLRRAGFNKEEITPHGFRAMLSTICYDNELDEKAIKWYLAHYELSSVSRAYNHSQGLSKKRKVLDFWWKYLITIQPL